MPSRDPLTPGRSGHGGAPAVFPGVESGAHALSRGELSEQDARELQDLKALIRERCGFSCDAYKERCLRRRLAVRMRARSVHRYADYAALLERDAQELERFLAIVTINVSKFFRNAEVWESFRRQVVPALFAMDAPEVRIWSAGCAGGEEPYSVAISLLEHAREHRLEARMHRFRILATDIDRGILEVAQRAEYGPMALEEMPPGLKSRWFEGGPRYRLHAEVKRWVRFAPLDLLNDPLPRGQHLILCRNVSIYFEREFQEALLERLREALVPGGYLVLGKVETLFGSVARSFEPIDNRERIFRKR
ncbi:MAG TPA: protein-glutamate O-methyltransferase CheR [Longimicrobiales bacterium]